MVMHSIIPAQENYLCPVSGSLHHPWRVWSGAARAGDHSHAVGMRWCHRRRHVSVLKTRWRVPYRWLWLVSSEMRGRREKA